MSEVSTYLSQSKQGLTDSQKARGKAAFERAKELTAEVQAIIATAGLKPSDAGARAAVRANILAQLLVITEDWAATDNGPTYNPMPEILGILSAFESSERVA